MYSPIDYFEVFHFINIKSKMRKFEKKKKLAGKYEIITIAYRPIPIKMKLTSGTEDNVALI